MTIDERVSRLENAFVTLTRLAENMDARIDRADERMDNFDVKLAALADAQIRTETTLATLTTNQSELTANQSELTANQSELTTKMSELTGKLAELSTKMSELAEAQAHTDSRLDALIDIISNERNGRE